MALGDKKAMKKRKIQFLFVNHSGVLCCQDGSCFFTVVGIYKFGVNSFVWVSI